VQPVNIRSKSGGLLNAFTLALAARGVLQEDQYCELENVPSQHVLCALTYCSHTNTKVSKVNFTEENSIEMEGSKMIQWLLSSLLSSPPAQIPLQSEHNVLH